MTKASDIPVHCSHSELADVVSLIPNPRNPNKHPDKQIAMLAKIIRHQGWRSPIVVSNRSGFVVKGHGRLEAAKLLQVEKVPVDRQDYSTEADEWADLIADNRIAELAETDDQEIATLLKELDGKIDLDLVGFDSEALTELDGFAKESDTDADPQIDKAEELRAKWGVEPGQLWELGDHRLLCGDSTKKEDVEKALGGASPLLMVTDPPYGVEYDPAWRAEVNEDGPNSKRAVGKVANDDRADWTEAWQLFAGDVAYVWHAGRYSPIVAGSLETTGLQVRYLIVWAKQRHTFGRGHYHHQHEPCWCVVRKGATAAWAGDRTQTTLWQIDNNRSNDTGHGTQKPVECMARPIRNHESEFVYEPFSGSGTTIIACEQLGRKCRAIEISPAYVAVALQRWADATGKTPVLISKS